MITRRSFVSSAAAVAGLFSIPKIGEAAGETGGHPMKAPDVSPSTPVERESIQPAWTRPALEPGLPGKDYRPVITLNGSTLPFKVVDGVKVFHLIAEEVKDHEFASGIKAHCWGYNGKVHGPTIEAVEGDRVRIYVTNHLPAATTVHWHGIILPNGMDGVGGLSQKPIQPGETFRYEFTLQQHGTQMYHSHHDEMTQMALGLMGLFIIHPRNPKDPLPDRDFAYMMSEWRVDVGTKRPNPIEMTDFNLLTFNARVFPGTAPMVVRKGDRVRIRLANLGAMDHHPIHIHGHRFRVIGTDAGDIPESAQRQEVTVLVAVGQTRTIEFIADNPGDWAFHCHMTHHTMNQMGHQTPNLIGVDSDMVDKKVRSFLSGYMTMGKYGMADMGEMGMKVPANSIPMIGGQGPHGYISMGGLFSILKVRENLQNLEVDPGWYENPPGTQASLAGNDEMERDLGHRLD